MVDLVSQSLSSMEVGIEFFQEIAHATFIGILIGIEREHRRLEERELIAGVRTFTRRTCSHGQKKERTGGGLYRDNPG